MPIKKGYKKHMKKTKKLLRKAGKFGKNINSNMSRYFSEDGKQAKSLKPHPEKVRF